MGREFFLAYSAQSRLLLPAFIYFVVAESGVSPKLHTRAALRIGWP